MAFVAVVKVNITAAGSEAVAVTLNPTYNGINGGRYDLPEGLGDPTPAEIDIPFGGVEAATLVYVRNMSGQELEVTVNGNALDSNLPDGGVLMQASVGAALAQPVAALKLTTTAPVEGAERYIEYRIAGDPVA